MFNRIKIILKDYNLRNKIFFVLAVLVLFRVGSSIPIPGVDHAKLSAFLSNNQFFGLLDIFSGGGLSNLSILMLGVAPYITASIIMQLFTMIFPKLKELYQEEGESGRQKIQSILQAFDRPARFPAGVRLDDNVAGAGNSRANFLLGQVHQYFHNDRRHDGFALARRTYFGKRHRQRHFPYNFRRHSGELAVNHPKNSFYF